MKYRLIMVRYQKEGMKIIADIHNVVEADKTVSASYTSDRLCQHLSCWNVFTGTECLAFRVHWIKCINPNLKDFSYISVTCMGCIPLPETPNLFRSSAEAHREPHPKPHPNVYITDHLGWDPRWTFSIPTPWLLTHLLRSSWSFLLSKTGPEQNKLCHIQRSSDFSFIQLTFHWLFT